jgi:hypothetical protein
MTDAESEFLKAIADIQPLYIEPLEYRLYYNATGDITSCSMQAHAPGDYIVVDKDIYNQYYHYMVVKGRVVKKDTHAAYKARLQKSTSGFPVVKNNANIILEQNEYYPDIEYYEQRNN